MSGQPRPPSAQAANRDQTFATPTISLPKGGGAARSIGEKFTANLATGTGALTVPLAVSPGRAGFGPQLALSYDSGAGNGPHSDSAGTWRCRPSLVGPSGACRVTTPAPRSLVTHRRHRQSHPRLG